MCNLLVVVRSGIAVNDTNSRTWRLSLRFFSLCRPAVETNLYNLFVVVAGYLGLITDYLYF